MTLITSRASCDAKIEEEKKYYVNLQDGAIWSQVFSLPKTAEFAISVQQPLIHLAGKRSCHKPCSVILFRPGMEIIELLRISPISRCAPGNPDTRVVRESVEERAARA